MPVLICYDSLANHNYNDNSKRPTQDVHVRGCPRTRVRRRDDGTAMVSGKFRVCIYGSAIPASLILDTKDEATSVYPGGNLSLTLSKQRIVTTKMLVRQLLISPFGMADLMKLRPTQCSLLRNGSAQSQPPLSGCSEIQQPNLVDGKETQENIYELRLILLQTYWPRIPRKSGYKTPVRIITKVNDPVLSVNGPLAYAAQPAGQ
ncbi:hypothetical protein CSKR_113861, partial [Clonorchis sinensis]